MILIPRTLRALAAGWLLVAPGFLWAQDKNPLPPGTDVRRNLEYASVDGISLKLDLYLPASAHRPMPVVLWVHGGAWTTGGKGRPLVLPLLKDGIAIASITYRFSQQAIFPAQLQDCKAAVRWLRAHAGEFGLDPNRIGAAGTSAGGHLVALLGTTAQHPELEGSEGNLNESSQVQAVVDLCGPTDFLHWILNGQDLSVNEKPTDAVARLIGGLVNSHKDQARAASPLYYVSASACPFFIVHGDQDQLVPLDQSIELNDALQKAGVASTLIVVKGGKHGTEDPAAVQGAFDFLRAHLLPPAAGKIAPPLPKPQ
jgi:acetyl esterase/lipase